MRDGSQKCAACNADLRPNAIFCHHCGYALTPDAEKIFKEQDVPSVETQNLQLSQLTSASRELLFKESKNQSVEASASAEISDNLRVSEKPEAEETIVGSSNGKNESVSGSKMIQNEEQKNSKKREIRNYIEQPEYIWTESEPSGLRVVFVALLVLILVTVLLLISHIGR